MTAKKIPRIVITAGEPAGIGPDLVVKLAQLNHGYDLTVIGDPDLLLERAEQLTLPLDISLVSNSNETINTAKSGRVNVLPVNLKTEVIAGKLNVQNASYVLELLDIATQTCLEKKYDAMVTTPIQKSIINDAKINFSGHTEYLAKQCGNVNPVMLLACPGLRIALVTTHLPLREIPDAITKDKLEKTIQIVIDAMKQQFGIRQPKITVCGLNPHAGEKGHLGTEEVTTISPVIKHFTEQGHKVTGPLPADTAFRAELRQGTDAYICMYHDQGLPVLKTLGFGEAVNITLGLPIVRTSVDHGTALNLAGTGKADCNSLLAAIDMANTLAQNHSYLINIPEIANEP